MATKNLSRTVIEGGRCAHYQSEVRESIRGERAHGRTYLRAVANDPELADECVAPKRKVVSPCFADKLRPIYGFLDSRLGRNWDTVRSELFAKFDTRTTPGRHVLFDHLLRDVRESQEVLDRRYARYFVDAQGRLCKDKDRDRRPRYTTPPCNLHRVAAWLGHRKVGTLGARFVWFVPTSGRVCAVHEGYGTIVYAVADVDGKPIRDVDLLRAVSADQSAHAQASGKVASKLAIANELSPLSRWWRPRGKLLLTRVSFRQSNVLDARDEAFFLALPAHVQKMLVDMAPANV